MSLRFIHVIDSLSQFSQTGIMLHLLVCNLPLDFTTSGRWELSPTLVGSEGVGGVTPRASHVALSLAATAT